MEMLGAALRSWLRRLVFFILIVRPNYEQARAKQLMSSLEGSLGVSCDGGVISEEHLPEKDFAHLSLGSKTCQVEQATISSSVQV